MARRIALAGIGKIARDQHIPSIAASDDWELAATVSRSGGIDGVENHKTLDALLAARPDIEVISLTMPPGPRFAAAKAALEAGRHVMLEKPPGASFAECGTLEREARERGVTLFASWHTRHAARVADARDWLAGKRLKRLAVTWCEDVRKWHPGQEWVWEPGGLGVFDTGINALSVVTEILQEDIHVTSSDLDIPENRQTPITARLAFHHPDGAEVTAYMTWRHDGGEVWDIEAETDDGTLLLSEGATILSIDGARVSDEGEDPGEYARLYAHLARLVDAGESDVDLAPFCHVVDALSLGRRRRVDAFVEEG
ncbi:Gfo/Idh/MocA family protein [Histidinibacterium lentulum]|uniref:Gfo/Idh/MocA family oxidoreductase n=1 Tax=Histidinibacterium lentulum TaxID=2480588 RepID=A0A3N2QWA6_9RHOB|nr:Gfo/Idh/MocA family oxidoreductase [Histidinibacterium lentulum]ROT99419.1 gfo/Idh/MocA family oxidoreductase [Histidinibacterium lentulum]